MQPNDPLFLPKCSPLALLTGWSFIRLISQALNLPVQRIKLWGLDEITDPASRNSESHLNDPTITYSLAVKNPVSPEDLNGTISELIIGNKGYAIFYLEIITENRRKFSIHDDEYHGMEFTASPPLLNIEELADSRQRSPEGHQTSSKLYELYESNMPEDDTRQAIMFIKQFSPQIDEDGSLVEVDTEPPSKANSPMHYIGKVIVEGISSDSIISDFSSGGPMPDSFKLPTASEEILEKLKSCVDHLSRSSAGLTLGSSPILDVKSSKFWIFIFKFFGRNKSKIMNIYPPKAQASEPIVPLGSLLAFQDGSIVDEFDGTSDVEVPTNAFSKCNGWSERKSGKNMALNIRLYGKIVASKVAVRLLPLTARDSTYIDRPVSSGTFDGPQDVFAYFSFYSKRSRTVLEVIKEAVWDHFGGPDGNLGCEEGYTRLRLIKCCHTCDLYGPTSENKLEPLEETKKVDNLEEWEETLRSDAKEYFCGNGSVMLEDSYERKRTCYFQILPFSKLQVEEVAKHASSPNSIMSTTLIAASAHLRGVYKRTDPYNEVERSPPFWLPLVEKDALIVSYESKGYDLALQFSQIAGHGASNRANLMANIRIIYVRNSTFVETVYPGNTLQCYNIMDQECSIPKGVIKDEKEEGEGWNKFAERGSFAEPRVKFVVEEIDAEERHALGVDGGPEEDGKLPEVVPIQVIFFRPDDADDVADTDEVWTPPLALGVPILTFLKINETGKAIASRVCRRLYGPIEAEWKNDGGGGPMDWEMHIIPRSEKSHPWVEAEMVETDSAIGPSPSTLWAYLKDKFPHSFKRGSQGRHRMMACLNGFHENDMGVCTGTAEDFKNCPKVGFMLNDWAIEKLKLSRALLCRGSASLKYSRDGICIPDFMGNEIMGNRRQYGRKGGTGIQFKFRDRALSL